DQQHLHETRLMVGQVHAARQSRQIPERMTEEAVSVLLLLDIALVIDDLAEVRSCEEGNVRVRNLAHDRVRGDVLDVGLDDRSTLPKRLDHHSFTSDGLVDEGTLRRRELARLVGGFRLLLVFPEDSGACRQGSRGYECCG